MKKLLIDLGNSCLKWAVKTEEGISSSYSFYYQNQDLEILLEKAWANLNIDKVVLASVADDHLTNLITQFAEKKWGLKLIILKTSLESYGLRNHYVTPFLLGVDRWAVAVAAWKQYQSPLCLVSCGTAITTDIINAKGELLGGTISPGLSFMCQSLSQRAAKLKTLDQHFFQEGKFYNPVLESKDTVTALTSGALLMAIAFLDQTAVTLSKKYGSEMRFIIRGGDAEFLLPHLKTHFEYQSDLVFDGIDLLDRV
jgi:type III pantothenate kinase